MKVVSNEALTKLIQLVKSAFIKADNVVEVTEIDTETTSEIKLATVATSGSYNDLSNKPTIPTVDQSYSGTSVNAQSGVAVKSAINSAISSVYKVAGSVAYASLPTPSSSNEGNVYNVTNAFTTDSRFIEGSGKSYPAGTNVVIINSTGVKNTTYYCYYYDSGDGITDGPYYLLNPIPSVGDSIYSIKNGVATKTKAYVTKVSNNQIAGIEEPMSPYPIYTPIPRYPANDVTIREAYDGYFFDVLAGMVDLSGYVPTTRTVNGKALSSNITLTASDVSALPSSTVIPTITDTYSATSSNGMSGKAVASAISGKANSSDLATVATSGSYNDLSNKPTIPTVNNATLTIQKNGTTINTFTANASSNVTANITVPTNTNELTNGAGFITSSSLPGIATTSTAGLVKPDGTTISVDANGTISSAGSVDIDEETITKNNDNELQVVAVKNKRDDSTLGIWHGTEYQWNHGAPTTWYYWQSDVLAQWVSGTMPSSTSWLSVTYGNGKFVAIPSNSTSVAAYSEDGINWTTTTLPYTDYYNFVTYCNGKFMAFSRWNPIACSEDGVNWTTIPIQGNLIWQSIAYGDGKYVVIAKYSTAGAYSEDGINWTVITLPSEAEWVSVAYGNGKFVAVANNSTASAYSEDGINWIASTLPNDSVMSVTYGNGKFVAAVFGSRTAIYSEDGIHWNSSNEIVTWGAQWNDITYGDGKFVAVERNVFGISTDGINWTAYSTPNEVSNTSVAYGDGKFVAVAYGSDVVTTFSQSYDKCYTDTATPTTTSVIYSEPETVSSYTILNVTSGAITLSNNNTYYYNQSGNAFTYRTIGDAHPEYLAFIDGVGIKKGNTLIASATPITTSITSTSTDAEVPSAKTVYNEIGEVESALNTINSGS